MRIAVVGGGINGVMSAWSLAGAGYDVELFERDTLISATSSASTKLLHGGLRYLEQLRFRLVREGLTERAWWLEAAPQHTRRIELILPLYDDSPRAKLKFKAGLALYDWFSGRHAIGRHRWLSRSALIRAAPELKPEGLCGGFVFHDGQMNDRNLGLWAAGRARQLGVQFHQRSAVAKVSIEGEISVNGEQRKFDFVVNAAGPWAAALLEQSHIASEYQLDLVRGSHLLFNDSLKIGFVLQSPQDKRICFALPYEGQTLLGTTEVRQTLSQIVCCSAEEACYLLKVYNRYFQHEKTERDIAGSFSGLRPLVRSSLDPTRASRECAIEANRRLITIYGGKWTSSRALGQKVTRTILERSRLLV
jgi:glycerol-3-phosphate dehydrogenase